LTVVDIEGLDHAGADGEDFVRLEAAVVHQDHFIRNPKSFGQCELRDLPFLSLTRPRDTHCDGLFAFTAEWRTSFATILSGRTTACLILSPFLLVPELR
jgi:hypothetical protein